MTMMYGMISKLRCRLCERCYRRKGNWICIKNIAETQCHFIAVHPVYGIWMCFIRQKNQPKITEATETVDEAESQNSNNKEESAEHMQEQSAFESEMADAPAWSLQYLLQYLHTNQIPVHDFSAESKMLESKLKSITTDFYLKGSVSDGFGRLYRIRNLGSDIDPEYDYFHEVMGVSVFDELEGIIKQQEDPQIFVSDYCNSLWYEGYFDEGKYEGKGNLFRGSGYYYVIHYATSKNDVDIISDAIKEYQEIIVGEYKQGEKDGEFKKYSQGRLLFEGAYKNDLRNGEGMEYYEGTDQIMYRGNYRNDECSGEGTLFDTQGNIVCSGEWIRNTCGTVNMDKYLDENVYNQNQGSEKELEPIF